MTNGFSLRTKPARPKKASLHSVPILIIPFLHIKKYFLVCDIFLSPEGQPGSQLRSKFSFNSVSFTEAIGSDKSSIRRSKRISLSLRPVIVTLFRTSTAAALTLLHSFISY